MIQHVGIISSSANHNLANYIWKLLRLRFLILINSFRHSKTRSKVGTAFVILFLFGLMIGAFFLSTWLLSFLTSPKLERILGDATPFLEAVPTLVLFAAFGGILITSFGVLLQALYLANDMEFLLSSPVPIRAVFLSKMLQAILPNLGLVMLFGLPVLFGLGVSQHYSVIYYPALILMMILLAFTAASLASLLVMGIVRIFPARRVAEVLAFIGAILSFVCGQSGQIFRFQTNNEQTVNALYTMSRVNSPWFPLAWAGRSLVELGHGNWILGILLLVIVAGISGAIVLGSLEMAERLYYSGWATTQISLRKKKIPHKTTTPATRIGTRSTWVDRFIPAPVRAIVAKDFLVIRRDIRNLSQLVTPLIFGVLYTFMLLRDTGKSSAGGATSTFNALITYGNTGIALFVGWMVLMRLALIAFSWMAYARTFNTQISSLQKEEYVQAARSEGVRPLRILFRHIFPNAISPIIVLAAKDISSMVVLQATFTFIGFQGRSAWAEVLVIGRDWIIGQSGNPFTYWWVWLPVTLAIILFGVGWNLLGDEINFWMNPKNEQ